MAMYSSRIALVLVSVEALRTTRTAGFQVARKPLCAKEAECFQRPAKLVSILGLPMAI
jgi:hypothetical protein